MEILEKGKYNDPWSIAILCTTKLCDAKLKIIEEDITPEQGSSNYIVICPNVSRKKLS